MRGVNVQIGESTRRSSTTDTGRVFVVGQATRGPINTYAMASSLQELVEETGARLPSAPFFFDGADFFYRERGSEIIFGRVVGANPVKASHTLKNAGGETTMTCEALDVGEWGDELKIQVIAEAANRIYVVTLAGVEVDRSPALATKAEAAAWSLESHYIRLVDAPLVVGVPAALAATSLAGGTEDAAHITLASYEAAEALLLKSLGCGNFCAPGITSPEIQKMLAARCDEKNRSPLFDGINSGVAATVLAAANEVKGKPGSRRASLYTPWGTGPGLAPGLPDRVIPYSMVQAGIEARNDASASPAPVNQPSAGDLGESLSLTGLAVYWDEETTEELDNAGVNPVILDADDGKIKTYGDNTLAPASEPAWATRSAARLFMLCYSQLRIRLKPFYKKDITQALISRAAGVCQGLLEELARAEMLANDPTQAVNVGEPVNTPATILAEELNVAVEVKPTPKADAITITLSPEAS